MADDEPVEDIVAAPPKVTRKRVSGADLLAAIERLPERIVNAIPGGDEASSDEIPEDASSLPPEVTFIPEEEPVPTPIATDAEVKASVPPTPAVGRRKGFPHRGRRGRG